MSKPTAQSPASTHPAQRARDEEKLAVSVLGCIDCRSEKSIARIMHHLGHGENYIDIRSAGAAFSFYFQELKKRPECTCILHHAPIVETIAKGISANLDAARHLPVQPKLYIVDHQDCAAFKAFTTSKGTSCLSYPICPTVSQTSKDLELRIHSEALVAAKEALRKRQGLMEIVLGVVDRAGAYGVYDEQEKSWSIKVLPETFDARALFAERGATSNSTRHAPCRSMPPTKSFCVGGFPPTPPMAPAYSPRLLPNMFTEMVAI